MPLIGRSLAVLGRHGPALLVLSLALGALLPGLAQAAYGALPVSAFLLTLGSFLTAALSPAERGLRGRTVLLVLAWLGLGVPLLAVVVLAPLQLDGALQAGVLLSVVAPPVGSAAAIAAILGLRPRLALVASISLTLLAPLAMPGCARLLGAHLDLDAASLALRLGLIVGLAAALAEVVRRCPRAFAPMLPGPQAAAGISVLGLIVVGLAMMSGIRAHWAANPDAFAWFLTAAVAVNLGLGVLGTGLFWAWGRADALTIGLLSGNRNVTLAWAAAGASLPAAAEAYVAACVLPVLALPLAVKGTLWLQGRLAAAFKPRAPRPAASA